MIDKTCVSHFAARTALIVYVFLLFLPNQHICKHTANQHTQTENAHRSLQRGYEHHREHFGSCDQWFSDNHSFKVQRVESAQNILKFCPTKMHLP